MRTMPQMKGLRDPSQAEESLLRECGEAVAEYGARLLLTELRAVGKGMDQAERDLIFPVFARHLARAIPHALMMMRGGLQRGTQFAATGTAFVTAIREAILDAIDEAYPGAIDSSAALSDLRKQDRDGSGSNRYGLE